MEMNKLYITKINLGLVAGCRLQVAGMRTPCNL